MIKLLNLKTNCKIVMGTNMLYIKSTKNLLYFSGEHCSPIRHRLFFFCCTFILNVFITMKCLWVILQNKKCYLKNISWIVSTKTLHQYRGPSWSWSYGSWIYNYLCNQCLSTITLEVQIPIAARNNIMWSSLSETLGRSVVSQVSSTQAFKQDFVKNKGFF